MTNYLTPDVYVEEISTLPPSVAQVSTAIPAFIGYTEFADRNRTSLINVPTRISTLLEYRSLFGGPDRVKFTVPADNIQSITQDNDDKQHRLYYALDHFFKNGGSNCYIVSVGLYDEAKTKADFEKGLDAVEAEDEPTLIILSEAATLKSAEYYELCQKALKQCVKLGDRFCIFDVVTDPNKSDTDNCKSFREGIGINSLRYGAAYYPYLNTSLNYIYDEADIAISGLTDTTSFSKELGGIRVNYSGAAGDNPSVEVVAGSAGAISISIAGKKLTIGNVGADGKPGSNILDAWSKVADKNNFSIEAISEGKKNVPVMQEAQLTAGNTLQSIKKSQTALYNSIKLELNKFRVKLPPSPAIAGVYATVDSERGVWKAPANVSLNAVINPERKITASGQETLNIDEDGGKSINAIRSFSGKGTLVWGARTLAGNDNEWRYVPVRRLFNMIEESAKKASSFAVFEPNHPATWLKVKGMIESYLYGLWQQGALAGSTPKAAYYVHVGLGTTMTQQDILEGRMIVEIGIAAVRPAEFIILRFSHKLQEA